MSIKFFGTPDRVHVGQQFLDRQELRAAGVHPPLQGGISGNRAEGADSIVISGGYPDDRDFGDYIIYTGHGGHEGARQVADQSVDATGNAGLITSEILGLPVRVTRGSRGDPKYSPPNGLQYAGLFSVTYHWTSIGSSGFRIVQFRLDRISEQEPLVTRGAPDVDPAFSSSVISRRIRDGALSRMVKRLYEDRCQLCGESIQGFEGRRYSEGAHVRPLGRPHMGADKLDNLLCLCPNHHTQLDIGGMLISRDFRIADAQGGETLGSLFFQKDHQLEMANVDYHRRMWVGTI